MSTELPVSPRPTRKQRSDAAGRVDLHLYVPVEVRRSLRKAGALRHKSMSVVVTELVQRHLPQPDSQPKRPVAKAAKFPGESDGEGE